VSGAELTPCTFCGAAHLAPELRLRCDGCGGVMCARFGRDGKEWARAGQIVHVAVLSYGAQRVCGTLRPVVVQTASPPEPIGVTEP